MSSLIVEVCLIDKVINHPNADKLDLVEVKGWSCVVGRDQFKVGDKCVYIPIDSVLPTDLEEKIFATCKVKPSNGRIKTIKIRQAISQGLVQTLDKLGLQNLPVGTDVASTLNITKYEPPEEHRSGLGTLNPQKKKKSHPDFHKYTSIENFKNYNKVFQDGEAVVVTEKIHGTNFRCGYVKSLPDTLFKKIKAFFGYDLGWEFVYGSHNVQLKSPNKYNGFYETNVYAKAVERYHLKEILRPGQVVYGEIYGNGIQKGYNYNCLENELVIFDLMENGEYQDFAVLREWCSDNGLMHVPVLYEGPFDLDTVKKYVSGRSVLAPSQEFREGVVIKPKEESKHPMLGRKVLKYISEEYLLLKNNSDWH